MASLSALEADFYVCEGHSGWEDVLAGACARHGEYC